MREFKFRAWWQHDKYNPDGAMYGVAGIDWTKPDDGEPERELCDMPTSVALVDYPYEVGTYQKIGWNENCELMQYTGIIDKNGKEIFEGDIVTATTDYGLDMRAHYIEFNTNDAAFTLQVDDACMLMRDVRNIEVIGNIYENPELQGE